MTEEQITFLILETIGSILVILGYLIKYKLKIQLVAGGYKNGGRIKDVKGFASLVGGNVLVSGINFCAGAIESIFTKTLRIL